MAQPIIGERTTVRPESSVTKLEHLSAAVDTARTSGPLVGRPESAKPLSFTADEAAYLRLAASAAGLDPEEHPAVAKLLSFQSESVLHQALRGAALPPPVHDEWIDPPPAGSFDAGIARVMGEQFVQDFANWARAHGTKIVGMSTNATKDLQAEVKRSYGFARYVTMLASGIRLAQDDENPEEEQQRSAEDDISLMAATAYLAGWHMRAEYENAKRHARAGAL